MNSNESPEAWLARIESLRRAVDLFLDRDGRWWHEGKPFTHQRLIAAFNSGIDLHPTSSEPIIRIGDRWCYFTAEDTPFIVTKVTESDGQLWANLNTYEKIGLPEHGLFLREERLYANLGAQRWAVFSRAAQAGLAPWLGMNDQKGIVLQAAARVWKITAETSEESPTDTKRP